MLDTDTKRRIDTARDILVGKVPDPKSQVEQITIALIYKFMDDMDAESEELGGKRKFFTKEFSRYGWAQLMRAGLGGHELLGLYAEGITKMPENPGIPLLFREIFKNAYLPYRDPETLKAFLKIIDEFIYDHSERLGDAFEYLLSVLGSQGDAGQFRTPRHIIDFIVAIVDPKKDETVLDPACGTAGFLISSYKHILRSNTDAKGQVKLTPDEKGRLAENFKGYDISPDMVRLSLVNLYLHGFTDPHIYEYDTLTSEDRWNEFADVILANPPFMSPKGGIKPHRRFSVQSKRSEVLFVDYMAEHLTPTGRAGIIVPEGIIFQSQSSYTELRRMLVENSLVAVVSLPAGVFNPYSGVKTSILILDKALAKLAPAIGFFKVENDGFGLGAQRRPIDKNDLPQVRGAVEQFLATLRRREDPLISSFTLHPSSFLIVPKEKIAANGDYNLSGERYREGGKSNSAYPIVELGEMITLQRGYDLPKQEWKDGPHPIVGSNGIIGYHAEWKEQGPGVVTGRSGTIGKVHFIDAAHYWPHNTSLFVKDFKGNEPKFVKLLLEAIDLKSLGDRTSAVPSLDRKNAHRVRVPLPPLEVQKDIVAEIEGYQKVINGARAVLDHYRPHVLVHPDWPMVELGEVCDLYQPKTITQQDLIEDGPYLVFGANGVIGRYNQYNHEEAEVLITCRGATCGTVNKSEPKSWVTGNAMVAKPKDKRLSKDFLFSLLKGSDLTPTISGSAQPQITRQGLAPFKIPLPSLEEQQAIVAEIEAERGLVAANRELITRFEKKIQATLARIWGEEELAAIT
jgi:type I restriction enzyme M protein